MATDRFYTSAEWLAAREVVLARDGSRCSVARLLGGRCRGVLHVNHILPRSERPDLALDPDNLGTACASHHPAWEALVRALRRRPQLNLAALPPCRHRHPYPEGRRQCERRRRRRLAGVA